MNVLTSLRRRFQRRRDLIGRHYTSEPGSGVGWGGEYAAPVAAYDAPTVAYEPHGIDTPETLAEIVAKARAAPEPAATEVRGEQDKPEAPTADVPAVEAGPPPPLPYPSGMSQIMVGQITYPDPSDLSLDKDRNYRDMLRRVGVATGTHTSLEDTGMWALPALEPSDGTGVRL